jgi:hypothetical protein
LIETFIKKETITVCQILKPALSIMMSIRHLGRITGESFNRIQECTGTKLVMEQDVAAHFPLQQNGADE